MFEGGEPGTARLLFFQGFSLTFHAIERAPPHPARPAPGEPPRPGELTTLLVCPTCPGDVSNRQGTSTVSPLRQSGSPPPPLCRSKRFECELGPAVIAKEASPDPARLFFFRPTRETPRAPFWSCRLYPGSGSNCARATDRALALAGRHPPPRYPAGALSARVRPGGVKRRRAPKGLASFLFPGAVNPAAAPRVSQSGDAHEPGVRVSSR
jgi:hypothetical protein